MMLDGWIREGWIDGWMDLTLALTLTLNEDDDDDKEEVVKPDTFSLKKIGKWILKTVSKLQKRSSPTKTDTSVEEVLAPFVGEGDDAYDRVVVVVGCLVDWLIGVKLREWSSAIHTGVDISRG